VGLTGPRARHGGDRIAEVLQAHRVRCIYTLCGGHISPILTAARARDLRIVDVRDEATAVFAADAAARLSGLPGVAAVTAGPGITNTLTALKNAQLAQSPVVLLGGAAPTALQGRGALQDIDQRPLVEPHVKRFFEPRRVRDLGPCVEAAFALARSGVPGPVFVECPVDLLYDEASIRQWYAEAGGKGSSLPDRALRWYLARHVRRLFEGSHLAPVPAARRVITPTAGPAPVRAALRALAGSERPIAVIGSQAVVQAGEAQRVAAAVTRLGIPVYLSGMARGLLGRGHPLQMRHQRRQALREADCVLLAGVPCDFRLDYGRQVRRSATLIAANRSARDARLNRRPDVTALGDAGGFLAALADRAPAGDPSRRAAWFATLRERDRAREAEIDRQSEVAGQYVNPIALLRAVEREAADDALFVADGGDFVATASYLLHPRAPLGWLDPGAFGTLGVGAGFALGAATALPDREVWIVFGDGACGFGLAEFDTFVRHGIGVIALVGNDAGWTQIAREQVKMLDDDVATVLARTAYHEVARGFGAQGLLVTTMADVEQTLRQARRLARQGKAVLVNVWLDRTAFREGSLSMWALRRARADAGAEPPDPEPVDRHARSAGGDQLGHRRAGARPELEAVGREAELVIHAFGGQARAHHREVVRHARLDPGPGPVDLGLSHDREQLPDGARAVLEPAPVDPRAVVVAIDVREVAAADHHGAVGELLERELALPEDHHRLDERRQAPGDHQHRRDRLERHVLAEHRRDAVGPRARRVDHRRRLEARLPGEHRPHGAPAFDRRHAPTLDEVRTVGDRSPANRLRGAKRIGRAVAARHDPSRAVLRHRGDQSTELLAVDQLLVREAPALEVVDAGAKALQLVFVLGDQHLSVAVEAAVVAHELLDALPDRHRRDRQRDLGDVARQLPHAAGIDAGRVPARVILLDDQRLHAAQAQIQRGGAPVDAGADDQHVGAPGCSVHSRTTALTAGSSTGMFASADSAIGLTGGRSRK
jgi:thiamine pyrophosphate-dependent acetolactate synthase large subunit-like protein